jgi:hypothetical protein
MFLLLLANKQDVNWLMFRFFTQPVLFLWRLSLNPVIFGEIHCCQSYFSGVRFLLLSNGLVDPIIPFSLFCSYFKCIPG